MADERTPRYRLFELDPITNLWRDKGWVEAKSQNDAVRQGAPDIWHFAVPEQSFHPKRRAQVQQVLWESSNGDEFTYEAEPDEVVEEV